MITLVAALADNRVIGRDGGMPWHLPGDLARFRALTMGHTLVMGRKTFESIGRALPGRSTIVVTRAQAWSADGVTVAHSIDEAIEAAGDTRVFVAGGGEIYAETIDRADRLELTQVHRTVDGDTYFPSIDRRRWRPTATDARDGYTFVRYERVGG